MSYFGIRVVKERTPQPGTPATTTTAPTVRAGPPAAHVAGPLPRPHGAEILKAGGPAWAPPTLTFEKHRAAVTESETGNDTPAHGDESSPGRVVPALPGRVPGPGPSPVWPRGHRRRRAQVTFPTAAGPHGLRVTVGSLGRGDDDHHGAWLGAVGTDVCSPRPRACRGVGGGVGTGPPRACAPAPVGVRCSRGGALGRLGQVRSLLTKRDQARSRMVPGRPAPAQLRDCPHPGRRRPVSTRLDLQGDLESHGTRLQEQSQSAHSSASTRYRNGRAAGARSPPRAPVSSSKGILWVPLGLTSLPQSPFTS